MKVVRPIIIDRSMLVSTNVTDSVPVWISGATYNPGDSARLDGYANKIYKYVGATAGVSTLTPEEDVLTAAPVWAEAGPTNVWGVFDEQVNTKSRILDMDDPSVMTYTIKPGICNTLVLFGLNGANSVRVQMKENSSATTYIYDQTQSLDATIITDWYDYFFEPFVPKGDAVFSNLPPFYFGEITVTITGAVGSYVECGVIIAGNKYDLGATQWGISVNNIDYSTKEADEFGTTTFVRRNNSKRLNASLMFDNSVLTKVHYVLTELSATPCAWIGTDSETLSLYNVYGYYKDFSIDSKHPLYSYCTLEIEGLI